jgi:hypothetical protein
VNDNRSRSQQAAVLLIMATISFPLVYFLSVGPYVWICNHGWISPAQIQRLQLPYYPLAWLCEHNEAFHRILDWYLELWGGPIR